MKRLALALIAATGLMLSACAMTVQQAGTSPAGFTGPRLEDHDVVSFDGARLGLMSWTPPGDKPWAVIVGVHGMNDYANAFHLAAPHWAAKGIATYAYDQRGFGRSPRRYIWADEKVLTEDLRTVAALVHQRYPDAVVAVAGESMGGAVAIETFASDRPPDASRLILISPGVWGWSTQPLPNRIALWVVAHVYGSSMINPPKFVTDHIRASDNTEELIAMGKDPLQEWGARSDSLYGLLTLMDHALHDADKVKGPVLDLHGDHDQIIPRAPALQAAASLPPGARTANYANGFHLLIVDLQARKVWDDIAAFIADPNAPLPSGAPPIPEPQ